MAGVPAASMECSEDSHTRGSIFTDGILAQVRYLFGEEAYRRLSALLGNYTKPFLDSKFLGLDESDAGLSLTGVELLAQLNIDLSMCMRGCRLHLDFDSWDHACSQDANFEAICCRIDSLYGPEISQDLKNLVKILCSKEPCLKCRCAPVLAWKFGPPSDWFSKFLSLRDDYDAACKAHWLAVTKHW
jgi:hypothetical protein